MPVENRCEGKGMQKAVGAFSGLLLMRVILPMLFGPAGMVYFCLSLFGVVLALVVLIVWSRLKMRRLRRKSCDDALLYARRKRRAFDEPDFSQDELRDVSRARRRGDLQAVHSLIALADKHLLDEKLKGERLASDQARKQKEAERCRPAEIRLYRA